LNPVLLLSLSYLLKYFGFAFIGNDPLNYLFQEGISILPILVF